MYYNTISQRYRRAFDIIKTVPMTLFGATVLMFALSAYALRSVVLWIFPIAAIPVTLLLSAGLMGVYLKAARNEKYEVTDLFAVFKDWKTLKHIVGGMLWMILMVYLWSVIPALAISLVLFIPTLIVSLVLDTEALFILYTGLVVLLWIAASVMAAIKAVEFSFTPFILISRPEIKATDAVKESSRLTKGIRLRIFGAIILPSIIISFVMAIPAGLAALPLIGWLFGVAALVLDILLSLGVSVFTGLVMAGFYVDALNPPPPPPVYGQYNQQYYNSQYYQQPAPAPAPEPTPAPAPAPSEETPTVTENSAE